MVGNLNQVSNYYNVSNGKVVRSYGKVEPEGVICSSRVNKNGDTVYEQRHDYIEGRIEKAEVLTHDEYGDTIKLTIEKGGERAVLSIKFDSSYGRSFLYKINSFNTQQEVRFIPYAFLNKEGKNITGVNVFQNGVKIKSEHTMENPNGLPPLKEVMFNGKKQWDKTEQLAFLKDKFKSFTDKFEITPQELEKAKDIDVNMDELKDLPF